MPTYRFKSLCSDPVVILSRKEVGNPIDYFDKSFAEYKAGFKSRGKYLLGQIIFVISHKTFSSAKQIIFQYSSQRVVVQMPFWNIKQDFWEENLMMICVRGVVAWPRKSSPAHQCEFASQLLCNVWNSLHICRYDLHILSKDHHEGLWWQDLCCHLW